VPGLRGRLARVLYDLRLLRGRLEQLRDRLERRVENLRNLGTDERLLRTYINALNQVNYAVLVLSILEVKVENILALGTVVQDLIVVREVLRELSRRVRNIPEVSAVLEDLGDSVGEIIAETRIKVDSTQLPVYREAARRIVEEAEQRLRGNNVG
jgi:division protein CdvB (Snf7/Vps24/ESCRT-III family)